MTQRILRRLTLPMRATARAATFFLKVFPMLPSRPVDWMTPTPVIDQIRYPTRDGFVEGALYRPNTPGPHPGILVCLGVVPFEVDHPQVPVLGNALARAGFAALLYWSPAMRDSRLDPLDNENLPLAYRWLIDQPNIDPARSGLLGTCVGGSFALMAAAHPLIQDQVAFIGAYAPFSSMLTFAADIASQTRDISGTRQPWPVDQLTRRALAEGGVQSRILPPCLPSTPLSSSSQLLYDLRARLKTGRVLGQLGDPRLKMEAHDGMRHIAPDLIPVLAGRYAIGSREDDSESYAGESLQFSREVPTFGVARRPVTNAKSACFIEASGYREERYWEGERAGRWLKGEDVTGGQSSGYLRI